MSTKYVPCNFASQGCKNQLLQKEIKEHEKQCQFRKVLCGFSKFGCATKVLLFELEDHEGTCNHRRAPCQFSSSGCTQELTRLEAKTHEDNCPHKPISMVSTTFNCALIKCFTCSKSLFGDVYECRLGHLSCKTGDHDYYCKCTYRYTGYLQQRFMDLVKEIDGIFMVPCCFSKDGCDQIVKLSEKDRHENDCDSRDFKCEIPNCDWTGKMDNICNHMKSNHRDDTRRFYANVNEIKLNLRLDAPNVKYLIHRERQFYFKQRQDKDEVAVAVQVIGTEKTAQSYNYKIEIRLGPKKIAGEDTCRSDSESFDVIIKENKCVTFSMANLKRFKSELGDLEATVIINKNEKNGTK